MSAVPPPQPSPRRFCLEPIFGSSCRTQSFAALDFKAGSYHVHYEAYLEDPVRKTWALTKIVHITREQNGKKETQVQTYAGKTGLTFLEVLETLVEIEQDWRKNAHLMSPLFPEAPQMGFAHFAAFAEREGYIFDTRGYPHARPGLDVMPAGATFDLSVVARADRNLQRAAHEFSNDTPANKIPHASFLFDQFTRAARKNGLESAMTQLRVLDVLDRFTQFIDAAHDRMTEYCANYQNLGFGGLIADAEKSLGLADATVRQIRAYGVDTKEFESFVLQCQIACNILHAQGLYDLMSHGKGDFEQNETAFKSRITKAAELFKHIDSTDEGLRALENMIVQAPRPEVPAAIGIYLSNYKAARAARPELPPMKQKPPAPKPPL